MVWPMSQAFRSLGLHERLLVALYGCKRLQALGFCVDEKCLTRNTTTHNMKTAMFSGEGNFMIAQVTDPLVRNLFLVVTWECSASVCAYRKGAAGSSGEQTAGSGLRCYNVTSVRLGAVKGVRQEKEKITSDPPSPLFGNGSRVLPPECVGMGVLRR